MSPRLRTQSLALDDAETSQIAALGSGDAISGSQVQSQVSCHLCQRNYARPDHLARHLRTHSQTKPFTCDICHKGFSRTDILKRHLDNHNSTNPNKRLRSSSQPKHRRVSRACRTCAEGKLKCSDNRPCERCVNKGLLCETGTIPAQPGGDIQSTNATNSFMVADGVHGPSCDSLSTSSSREASPRLELQPSNNSAGHSENMTGPQTITRNLSQPGTDHIGPSQVPQLPALLSNYDTGPMLLVPQDLSHAVPSSFHDHMMVDFMSSIINDGHLNPQLYPQDTAFLPDILDFAFDDSFDFQPTDGLHQHLTRDVSAPQITSGTATPSIQRLVSVGQQAFNESMWLWTPARGDSGTAEQANLSLPTPELVSGEPVSAIYQLSQASRDRILALILRTCEPIVQRQVVTCFPSGDMLSGLLTSFIVHHSHQSAPWIHIPSLDIDGEREDFVLAMIASGAAISVYPNVRKLGYAMQEAIRHQQPELFDSDNRVVRDLRVSQSYALQLQIGLWSGNRRKMEIAESFTFPLVTMLRRGAKFRQKVPSDTMPLGEDDPQTVESKWKRWIEYESFKRLAYHLFLTDTGISFSLMNQPLISHTELLLDLPCPQVLWQASSAQEWREIYQRQQNFGGDEMPNFRSALEDLSVIDKFQSFIDPQMSLAVIVSTIWSRIWQCLQMKSLSSTQLNGCGGSSMLTVNTYHQELVHAAKNISLRSVDWKGGLGPYAELLLELCMLHLHVSLESVQLLAGKNGEDEARKVVPVLRHWIKSPESRQAVYHAGRLLMAARLVPFGHLRDQSAVAVYHAGLALWAYAVLSDPSLYLTEANGRDKNQTSAQQPSTRTVLDNPEGPEMQRFLILGDGDPAIRVSDGSGLVSTTPHNTVALSETLMAMKSIAGLLSSKNGDEQQRSPMIGNLNTLILALGKAAMEMKKKSGPK